MKHNTIRWLCFFLIFTLIMGCAPINQDSSLPETNGANRAATETLTPTSDTIAIESSPDAPVALTPVVSDAVSSHTNRQPGSQGTPQVTATETEMPRVPILVFDSTISEQFADTSWTTHLLAEAPLTCEPSEGEVLCWGDAPLQVIEFQVNNGEGFEITSQPRISRNIGFQIILPAHPENLESDGQGIKLSIIVPNVTADSKLTLFSGHDQSGSGFSTGGIFSVWKDSFEHERMLNPPIPFGKGQAVLKLFTNWVLVSEPGNSLIAYIEESRTGQIFDGWTYQEFSRMELRVK